MTETTPPSLLTRPDRSPASRSSAAPIVNPFLHLGTEQVHNPLNDRTVKAGEPGFGRLRALASGEETLEDLNTQERAAFAAEGWLLSGDTDPAERYYLKYVSLEAHTVCNQSCYFCPVSFAPREYYFM